MVINKILFTILEIRYLIRKKPVALKKNFFFHFIILLCTAIISIFIFNSNYLIEVYSTHYISNILIFSLAELIYYLGEYKYFFYFFIIISFLWLFYLNFVLVNKLYLAYEDEIEYILNNNGNIYYGRLPILYIVVFVNIFYAVIALGVSELFYNNIFRYIVVNYLSLSLLNYSQFNLTLLLILALPGIISGAVKVYLKFRKY